MCAPNWLLVQTGLNLSVKTDRNVMPFNALFTPVSGVRLSRWTYHMPVLIAVGVILTLPTIIYGFPFFGDDSAIHTLWYTSFSHQLWSGELYPRWLVGMNGGLGSPAFFYYPPAS